MIFDTHVHTKISTDSDMEIEEAIKAAGNRNVGLIITEHMDLNHPDPEMFRFNVDEYFNAYGNYRGKSLLLGVEIGMTEEILKKNEELNNYDFDYLIGSIHFLGNYDIYYKEAYEGKSKHDVYTEYLQTMYNNIKCHTFIDSLGHIDYISRYAPYDDKEIYYHEYREIITAIFSTLIENNIALEINTRRLGNKSAAENIAKLYKEYHNLGGKYITIGSDAHNEKAIASNFSVALGICENCNLTPVYFKNRNIQYI